MIWPSTDKKTETMKLEPDEGKRLEGKGGEADDEVRMFRRRAKDGVGPYGLYGNGLGAPIDRSINQFPFARGKGVTALCLN